MPIPPKRWHEVTPSKHAHERDALAYLREHLPGHEPCRAWTNFEFLAQDGSVNEVDALVVGRNGLFLVEIKGHPGEVSGDSSTLRFRDGVSIRATIDHPLYLANLKAKRLKSLLSKTKTGSRKLLPRVEALVFLSHATHSKLESPADSCVLLKDLPAAPELDGPARDGLLAALLHRRAPGLPSEPQIPVDKPMAKALAKALEEIGLRRVPERLRVRDYEIIKILEETALWRDMLGQHTASEGTQRRIRRYFGGLDSPLDRDAVTRAAKREFQVLERLRHPGVLAAKDFTVDEQGPLILFEHLPDAQRLDRYLVDHESHLSQDARLALLRQIAEAVRHAHGNQIVHRSLSPQCILVVPDGENAPKQLRIMNWSAGGGEDGSTSVVRATLHPESHTELSSAVYHAPELRRDPTSTDPTLDVFSLGAIAWRLFAGQPPASSTDELVERTKGGLRLSATLEGTTQALDDLVAAATDARVSARFATVDDFLRALDAVEEGEAGVDEVCEVPPDAGPGDRLEGNLLVRRRLGSGSTAVAFLVERPSADGIENYVLKVARDPAHSDRVAREAKVLAQLEHPNITRLVEEVQLGLYRGILTQPANDQTLRQRLQKEGPLQLEFLERFGLQLLDALVHLEDRGLNHRDLKPDNIALASTAKQALSLLLFDFSLSGAPLDELSIGTVAYTDPFLADRKRKRWDLDAERYSAGLTLHEMATGALPTWGDGKSDPRATDEGVATLEAELFPADLRGALIVFFQQALARDPAARFDNAAAMRAAWNKVFQGTRHAPFVEAPEDAAASLAERTRAMGVRTSLHELLFSTRAANALDRQSLFTVEDLLRTPPNRMRLARGVGAKTRGELDDITRALRQLFPEVEISAEPPTPAPDDQAVDESPAALGRASIDELFALLVPPSRSKQAHRDAFDALYGRSVALALPTQAEAAKALGLTPQQLQPILVHLRDSWAKKAAGHAVIDDCATILERQQGILVFAEAADALLGQRGSARDGDAARAVAFALVRMATETESRSESPRWKMRRRGERVWLTTDDALVRYAEQLGHRAEQLAKAEPLPGREAVEAELARVKRPDGVAPLLPGRLARLAAASAGDRVDLSGRGELYPVDLDAERALRLSIGALVGAGTPHPGQPGRRLVALDEIRQRVRSRYPRAAELPDRPQLDTLLGRAGWDATWSDKQGAYLTRVDDALTMASGSTLLPSSRTPRPAATIDSDSLAVDAFLSRIRTALEDRRFFVLKAKPRDLAALRSGLETTFPELESVDLDARLFATLEAVLSERGIDREIFYAAEAKGPGGPAWRKVTNVMKLVLQRIERELSSASAPLCLRNVGLLGRFDDWSLVDALNPMTGGRPSRSTLLLLPGDTTEARAILDGAQLPHLPGQVIVPPDLWLASLRSPSARKR